MRTKAEIIKGIENTKKALVRFPKNKERYEGAIDALKWVME